MSAKGVPPPRLFQDDPTRKGPVELAALADIRELKSAGALAAGSKALQMNYRLAARNVDRAEVSGDTYAVVAASAQFAKLRQQLAGLDLGVGDDKLETLHAEIAATLAEQRP